MLPHANGTDGPSGDVLEVLERAVRAAGGEAAVLARGSGGRAPGAQPKHGGLPSFEKLQACRQLLRQELSNPPCSHALATGLLGACSVILQMRCPAKGLAPVF